MTAITYLDNGGDERICCGCGACVQICPAHAIAMAMNRDGFAYPVIDATACISCGDLCRSVCPYSRKDPLRGRMLPESWAVQCKDDALRVESSSGGVFSLLADWMLGQGGIVCGAQFLDGTFRVGHRCVDDEKGIPPLRRSKYLQSGTIPCFMEIRKYLDAGRPVLFVGTPCQIDGLRHFLGGDHAKLFTADLICHGVPSQFVFDAYRLQLESTHGARIKELRWKGNGLSWNGRFLKITFHNGTEYIARWSEDLFCSWFLKNMGLRPSCYECRYANLRRMGDMTLGDFWRIKSMHPEYDDDKGTSLVYLSTDKGRRMFSAIENRAVKGACTLDESLESNSRLERPARVPEYNEMFWRDFHTLPFSDVMRRYAAAP